MFRSIFKGKNVHVYAIAYEHTVRFSSTRKRRKFKMKKKTISLLMAASLAASSLAGGIVSFAEESDPITLSVWAPFTGSDGDVLREIIDNYNETNTDNITVQIDIMDNATLQSKLPTAVSTGTGPSFVLVGIEFLQQYAKNGLIEDISDFWDVTGIDKSNFYENVLAKSYVGDTQYGVPMQYNLQYLYYNKDIFEAAGLDPETPPTTLDELKEDAIACTDASKNQYGIGIPYDYASYCEYLWANGGDVISTDGKENLMTSIEIAIAQNKEGRALAPEVCIFFENHLMRGNRTTQMNAENFNAFRSFNYPVLAEAGIHIKYNNVQIHGNGEKRELKPHYLLDTNVVVLKLFPGIQENVIATILGIEGLKAVVLETYGSGNAPRKEWFIRRLCQASERGIVIVNVTQCSAGMVEMERYETGYQLLQAGVVSGYDSTTESAVTKLMFLLGHGYTPDEVRDRMNRSIAGEITL